MVENLTDIDKAILDSHLPLWEAFKTSGSLQNIEGRFSSNIGDIHQRMFGGIKPQINCAPCLVDAFKRVYTHYAAEVAPEPEAEPKVVVVTTTYAPFGDNEQKETPKKAPAKRRTKK